MVYQPLLYQRDIQLGMSTGSRKHKFYTHEKCLSQSYRVGCHLHKGGSWSPPKPMGFPQKWALSGKSSYLRVESLGLQQSRGDLRSQWRKARGGPEPRPHFTFYLHSKFQSSCPHLPSLFPTLIPTPRHYLSKLEVENKAYNTWNWRFFHLPFCPFIHAQNKITLFVKSYII